MIRIVNSNTYKNTNKKGLRVNEASTAEAGVFLWIPMDV